MLVVRAGLSEFRYVCRSWPMLGGVVVDAEGQQFVQPRTAIALIPPTHSAGPRFKTTALVFNGRGV